MAKVTEMITFPEDPITGIKKATPKDGLNVTKKFVLKLE